MPRFAAPAQRLIWASGAATRRPGGFEDVDEVSFFSFEGDRIAAVWGIEDTLDRFRQLGLEPGGG